MPLPIDLVANYRVILIDETPGGSHDRVQRSARVAAQVHDPGLDAALLPGLQDAERVVSDLIIAEAADAHVPDRDAANLACVDLVDVDLRALEGNVFGRGRRDSLDAQADGRAGLA